MKSELGFILIIRIFNPTLEQCVGPSYEQVFTSSFIKKMISVIVTYQVKPEFVEQNKKNIQAFLADFEQLDASKFEYSVFLKEDGVSFVHYSRYADEVMQNQLLNVPSFKAFQQMRDDSGLNDSHQVEVLHVIGSKGELL